MPDDLRAFQRILTNFRSLALVIIGGAALPLLAKLGSWEPPKPQAVSTITSALVVVTLLWVYQSVGPRKIKAARRWFKIAVLAGCVAGAAYLVLETAFTFEIPTTKERINKGFVCTANARLVYAEQCPFLDSDALAGAEYEPTRLWTPQSIYFAQVFSVSAWLLMFTFFAAALGTFLALHELKFEKRRSLGTSD